MSDTRNVPIAAIPYEIYRAQDAMKAYADAAELKMDMAPEGGVYINETGQRVDANGQPIAAKSVPASHARSAGDDFAAMTVAELRELAETRRVDVPADAKKGDLIAALQSADGGRGSGQGG